MQLQDNLKLDCTKSAVHCSSKKRALELISEIAAESLNQNPLTLFEYLLNREKMGSTGIGHGIAIPHARIFNNAQAVGVFIQCVQPFDFGAVDNQPVDLLFALFVPDEQCNVHLKTLSFIAEKLGNKQICRQLRAANSDQALYDIIVSI